MHNVARSIREYPIVAHGLSALALELRRPWDSWFAFDGGMSRKLKYIGALRRT